MLYPIKFIPHLLPKVWGGTKMTDWYNARPDNLSNIGESWVVSGYGNYVSVVENGHLAGDDLSELIEVYADELVGEKVYELFGTEFPLLFKFIDANDDLSVQVHPNDEQADILDGGLGKEEMWYVLPSSDGASIYYGWNQHVTPDQIRQAISSGQLTQYLKEETVSAGDIAMIHPGIVHALRKGTVVAEIQESSDLTYRLYDYNRPGSDGQLRPLHIEKALQVLNLEPITEQIEHLATSDGVKNLVQTSHFTANLLHFTQAIKRDYAPLDSFVVMMCVEGGVDLTATEVEEETDRCVHLSVGQAALIPASLNDIIFTPISGEGFRLLEVYIE